MRDSSPFHTIQMALHCRQIGVVDGDVDGVGEVALWVVVVVVQHLVCVSLQ